MNLKKEKVSKDITIIIKKGRNNQIQDKKEKKEEKNKKQNNKVKKEQKSKFKKSRFQKLVFPI